MCVSNVEGCVNMIIHLELDSHNQTCTVTIRGSIVVSIPACHAGDRGSIPRRGGLLF